jgi:hypothetical protein
MNGILVIGAMFVFAGAMGLVNPLFATQSAETFAMSGDLKPQSGEDWLRPIPLYLSGGLLAAGLILISVSRKIPKD